MPWFRFDADYDWMPNARRHVHYPAGYVGLITTACAKQAEAMGRGQRVKRPDSAHFEPGDDAD